MKSFHYVHFKFVYILVDLIYPWVVGTDFSVFLTLRQIFQQVCMAVSQLSFLRGYLLYRGETKVFTFRPAYQMALKDKNIYIYK